MMNATLAFCILALTSSAVPPCLLIVLPRYVNESVSSSGSPFIVMGLLFFVLAFIILVLLLLMLSPSCVDTVFSSSVFSCICWWLCERRARSSAKSTSSNWLQGVHWIPFLLYFVVFFMIQSMASRNKNGDRRHPCLTPVFTMKESVSCPAWWPCMLYHRNYFLSEI